MFQFPAFAPSFDGDMTSSCRVAPFGNHRIKACLQLHGAYRSLPRPSSPTEAQASTVRSCNLLSVSLYDTLFWITRTRVYTCPSFSRCLWNCSPQLLDWLFSESRLSRCYRLFLISILPRYLSQYCQWTFSLFLLSGCCVGLVRQSVITTR